MKVALVKTRNLAKIMLPETSEPMEHDLVVSYWTKQTRKLSLALHTSDKYPHEVVAHIFGIPRFSPEHENSIEEEKTSSTKLPKVRKSFVEFFNFIQVLTSII